MTQQESPKGRRGQRTAPDSDGRAAAVAAVAAPGRAGRSEEGRRRRAVEWHEQRRVEVEIGGATWELWSG